MKGRKINLENYIVSGTKNQNRVERDGITPVMEEDGVTQAKGALYDVKHNMCDVFMSIPASGREVIKNMKLGAKLDECTEDFIVLDTVEYVAVKTAIEKFEHFRPKVDGEMVVRVLEAEIVDMVPAK